jgi:hypothetical protein
MSRKLLSTVVACGFLLGCESGGNGESESSESPARSAAFFEGEATLTPFPEEEAPQIESEPSSTPPGGTQSGGLGAFLVPSFDSEGNPCGPFYGERCD